MDNHHIEAMAAKWAEVDWRLDHTELHPDVREELFQHTRAALLAFADSVRERGLGDTILEAAVASFGIGKPSNDIQADFLANALEAIAKEEKP